MGKILIFISVLLSISFATADNTQAFPNKEATADAMMEIYGMIENGTVPAVTSQPKYFYGQCITPYSAAATPQFYSAVLGYWKKSDGSYWVTYSTSTGGKFEMPNLSLADLQKKYALKERKAEELVGPNGGTYVQATIAEASETLPKIIVEFSMDQEVSNLAYMATSLTQYYCLMAEIAPSI